MTLSLVNFGAVIHHHVIDTRESVINQYTEYTAINMIKLIDLSLEYGLLHPSIHTYMQDCPTDSIPLISEIVIGSFLFYLRMSLNFLVME